MVKAENSGGEAQSIADFLVMESQPDRMVEVTKTVVFNDLPPEQSRVSLNFIHLLVYSLHILFLFRYSPYFSEKLNENELCSL